MMMKPTTFVHGHLMNDTVQAASLLLFFGLFLALYYRYLKRPSNESDAFKGKLAQRIEAMDRRLVDIRNMATTVDKKLDRVTHWHPVPSNNKTEKG